MINEEDEHDSTTAKLLFDILIMAHANGKERNKKEWENLFFEAGFSHYKISSSFGIKSPYWGLSLTDKQVLIILWLQKNARIHEGQIKIKGGLSTGAAWYIWGPKAKIDHLVWDVKLLLINMNYVEFFLFLKNFIDRKNLIKFFILVDVVN